MHLSFFNFWDLFCLRDHNENKYFCLSCVIPEKNTQFSFIINICYVLFFSFFFFLNISISTNIFNISIIFLTFSLYSLYYFWRFWGYCPQGKLPSPPTSKITLTLTGGHFPRGQLSGFPPTLKLTLTLTQTATLTGRTIFLGGQLSGYHFWRNKNKLLKDSLIKRTCS